MMKIAVYMERLTGYFLFGYNLSGYMVLFENCTIGMSQEAHTYMMSELRYCLTVDALKGWVKERKHKMEFLPPDDLSFENNFWWPYALPKNKIEAQRHYAKLDDDKRRFVRQSLLAYSIYCERNKSWYNKKYPDGYLNPDKEQFMTEWFKMLKK